MIKKLYYHDDEAFNAARGCADACTGTIRDTFADDDSLAGAERDFGTADLLWIGEVPAFVVEDSGGTPVGLFAYWEESLE